MPHTHLQYPLEFLLLGVLLLLLGRKLFWLFLGAAGFVAGVALAPRILPHQGELIILLAAAFLGILGALLAIFLQKVAIVLSGFSVGAYLAVEFLGPALGLGRLMAPTAGTWICVLIGGIIGAILMLAFFNWALIILSSLYGSHLIVIGLPSIHGIPPIHRYSLVLSIILAVIGIVVQASTYRRRDKTST